MNNTFFFYDLETSGLSARADRIMQFAGQRTNLDFEPIGEPVNILVKLGDDTLPSPGAIMVTKITPQQTQMDGLGEAEFCKYVSEEIFTPGTIAVGYNSVRFDDEFMRHAFWRNFYDPYEWQWKDGRSRWDLLDVVRLTRALRPEGIKWPVREDGKPTNRLELLTAENGISHEHAHDALSDVSALIAVTKLLNEKQPKMYDYLFKMRDKNEVKKLVNLDEKKPFVYASGRYSSENMHTTVAFPFAVGNNGNVLVFDLRYDLEELLEQEKNFVPEERVNRAGEVYMSKFRWNPFVKELCYNKCPAVAPLGVLESGDGWKKIGLNCETVKKNLKILLSHPEFAERMRTENEAREFGPAVDAESALYDGFLCDRDRAACVEVRGRDANGLADFHPEFVDERLPELLLHYKARNFRSSLTEAEMQKWEEYRRARLTAQEKYFVAEIEKMQGLLAEGLPMRDGREVDESILEDLMLWYQSLAEGDY